MTLIQWTNKASIHKNHEFCHRTMQWMTYDVKKRKKNNFKETTTPSHRVQQLQDWTYKNMLCLTSVYVSFQTKYNSLNIYIIYVMTHLYIGISPRSLYQRTRIASSELIGAFISHGRTAFLWATACTSITGPVNIHKISAFYYIFLWTHILACYRVFIYQPDKFLLTFLSQQTQKIMTQCKVERTLLNNRP